MTRLSAVFVPSCVIPTFTMITRISSLGQIRKQLTTVGAITCVITRMNVNLTSEESKNVLGPVLWLGHTHDSFMFVRAVYLVRVGFFRLFNRRIRLGLPLPSSLLVDAIQYRSGNHQCNTPPYWRILLLESTDR